MNRFITFLLVMGLAMTASTSWAELINENQAKTIAMGFMANHGMPSSSLRMAQKGPRLSASTTGDKAAYYVFNANRGYVIVAGDDRAPAVLGYSDQSTFDANSIPDAMQELLNGYTAQINALSKGGKSVKLAPSGPAIHPLVTANWSQNSPYNILFPILNNGQQAVAGCVATAMAQVLYYWKHPTQVTTTLPEYTSQTLNIYMPALEPVDFNWDAMQDTYLSNDTVSEGAVAAARLTLYCAQSLQMDFLYGSSGANTTRIPRIIANYFGYKASARCEYRSNYTTQSWADFIYSELAEGRPLIYSGSKASSGHAFICDGYDGEGLFHINWGWNGMSNGYYVLNVLNPDAQGTGSASEAYGYIYDQYVVAGIEPGEADSEFAVTAGEVALNGAVTTRTSSNANFIANVTGRFYNYTPQTISVSFGWGLYDGETLLATLYNSGGNLPSGYYYSTNNQDLSFGRNITSGTYRIVPIYSELYANNWRPCKGSDVNFIEVTIDGDNCTVTGYGTAGNRDYQVNSITPEGFAHHGRPVDLALNITNNGYTQNDRLYMFVNGSFNSTAFVSLEHGETADIMFRFLPTTPGDYTCVFSFNQDGSEPLCQTTITVDEMPAAYLDITAEVLNITDPQNYIITSDKYSVKLTITNNGSTIYMDDITVKLYKNMDGTYGTNAQIMNKELVLEPGQTAELQFDMDNVIDGWDYFAAIYYYSAGQQVFSNTTPYYTIIFPSEPEYTPGDVNEDGAVNISDVTVLIDYLLNSSTPINTLAADINEDGSVNISDVTILIDYLLSHN